MNRAVNVCLGLFCALAFAEASRAENDLLRPEEILHRVFAHARAVSDGQCYTYTKQTEIQEIDPGGHIVSRRFQVSTGRSRPAGPAEACKWSNGHGVNLSEELLDRYALKITGRVQLQGRPTLEIQFSPKNPPAPVHHQLDRLLNRATGTLWIDEEDYELAQADLRLTEPVNLSILGAINDLSFRFERARSSDGDWLITRTESNFRGRRLLNPVQSRHITNYTGYTRLGSGQMVSYQG
jgi:hypothetical protein